ncbi:MAG: hypothetical protein AB7I38_03025 [Dehalococcoidia bacterium]
MLRRWGARLFYAQLAVFACLSAVLLFLLGLAALLNLNPFLTIVSWLFGFFVFGISLAVGREALRTGTQRDGVIDAVSEIGGDVDGQRSESTAATADGAESGVVPTSQAGRSAIVVERRNHWVGRLGHFDVYVDGVPVAVVEAGQTARVVTRPGRRGVQVRAAAGSSEVLSLDLHPGDVVRLVCGTRGGGWKMMLGPYIGLLRHSLYLTVAPHDRTASSA